MSTCGKPQLAVNLQVFLLERFAVTVDGVPVASEAWSRRQAAALVKLLALAPGHRMHREQVAEALCVTCGPPPLILCRRFG